MKKHYYLFLLISLVLISADGYSQYSWKQRANFGGVSRSSTFGFSLGNYGYIGGGYDGSTKYKDFWQFDPASNTWTQKSSLPIVLYAASTFTVNDSGYVVGGISTSSFDNTLYMYNPNTNAWTTRATYPGPAIYGAAAFSIGTKGYFGVGNGGSATGPYYNDFYEYDAVTNAWTKKTDFAGLPRYGTYGIAVNGKGYVGCGASTTLNTYFSDWWEYNPVTNAWTQKANLPSQRSYIAGFVINSTIYVGVGSNFSGGLNDFYEYNASTDAWIQKQNYGGGNRWLLSGFSIGNIGYFGTGADGGTYNSHNEFWEYAPDSMKVTSTQTNATCFGGNNGSASLSVTGGVAPFTYVWSPGGQTSSSISNLTAGTYIAVVTDSVGLSVSDTIIITQGQQITSSVSVTICNGQSVTLPDNSTVNPTSSTSYTTHLTSHSGCDSAITTNVTVNQLTSSTANINTCGGQSITLPDGTVVTPTNSTTYTTHIPNAKGCDSVITTNVTVGQGGVAVTISISATVGCQQNTIYIGYGPQTVTLTANSTSTVSSYQWYVNGKSINGATSKTLVVSKGGSYNVVVTNGSCSSNIHTTTPVYVSVIDIRCGRQQCGNHSPEVEICHQANGNCNSRRSETLCMNVSEVESYLRCHPGDCLGSCSCSNKRIADGSVLTEDAGNNEEFVVNIYPNPFTSKAIVEFETLGDNVHAVVELYTLTGKKVSVLFDQDTEAGVTYQAEVDGDNLEAGIYIYRIIGGPQIINGKLILVK